MIAENLFLAVASPWRRLPNFRGKVRALLALHRSLGLGPRHVVVERVLHRPIPYRARLDLHCDHERMALLMDGYEADTAEFLFRLFDRSGCFLDIGANIGLISLPFTRLALERAGLKAAGRDTPVTYCVEALRSNHHALVRNVALNDLGQWMRPLCVGVGECEKTVEINVEHNLRDGEGTGTANIVAESSTYACERIPLHISTVDALIGAGQIAPDVTLIKLDTDGYDLFALMGATGLLKKMRPLIFGEFMAACLSWHGQTAADVAVFARGVGYETFARSGKAWRFTPLADLGGFNQDLLLVPKEKRSQVAWCLA
jgi:FkbM family methyltransferase